ncbi:MAG: response regulator [Phycisphaerae bacterium]|nr:response regulator [Phycisphaerae bacterium]
MARAEDMTVLVVDDEPNVRLFLQTALEDAGFSVVTAADGDEALEMIKARKPDFISTDLVMPNRSGPRLLYELKRDKALSRIPVLIVTAHAKTDMGKTDLEDIMADSVMSGLGIYLEKPVKPAAYVRHVKEALGIDLTENETDRMDLRDELQERMRNASSDEIRRALDALKRE